MDSNDRIIRRWFQELWNERKEQVIDELADPNIIANGLRDAQGGEVKGIPEFKQFYKAFSQAFPDIRAEVKFTVSEGDRVVAFLHCTGTHSGDQLGFAATGSKVGFDGVVIARIRNGRFVETWNTFDFMAMYQQLGVLAMKTPQPAATA